jgi:outer membrane protein TolC
VKIALEREAGLEREVESGARASIFLTENRQNILRRQRFARAARREFELASNDLAFYLRDEDGRPRAPEPERLPDVRDSEAHVEPVSGSDVSAALLERPELRLLRNAIARAENRIALGENELRPRVDLKVEVGDGLGETGEGGSSRDTTDTIVGLEFSVPLQRRRARGELAAERAERDAILFAERQLSERIEIEVRNILVELDAATELVNIASEEVTQARLMQQAEVRRFESGASDFFLVNIREEAAADARVRFLSAELERRIAEAEDAAATVDLPSLGLEES